TSSADAPADAEIDAAIDAPPDAPPDACVANAELCNAHDDDCDGHVDEGYSTGLPCDGADADSCAEGFVVCSPMGGTMCSDMTGNNVELCNGLDDDCKNGVDDAFPVGQPCSVGLGACARSGQLMCNSTQTGTVCNASAGAPSAETCGNAIDEDCNGADAVCPGNDSAAGAFDISAGGTFTVDLTAAHDDNWAASTATLDCGDQGGRDAFYQFTLPAEEVVYYDSFGSNFDTVIRIYAGACTSLGAVKACADDACSTTRSQGALDLLAGTYCLVLDQFSSTTTAGSASLTFKRGGRSGVGIATASGSQTGTTTGKTNVSIAGCEANSAQPDVGYFFLSCPSHTYTVSASTCSGTAFDSVIYLRSGAATTGDVACSDDESGCGTSGFQSRFTGATVTGANINWLIVDGFGQTGNGNYTLTYTVQ
ncbi:MAG TPA: MopE-related protein, partial [Kofleriaceae bacterium]|nr:MopE-related protein [Kofleriaceae bacterium]